ncbi:hypothetical protein JHK82_019513 [Glycine max]|nr:hypothetical protein JHK82_019513 [Glycine max]
MVKKVRMPRKGKEKDQGETSRDGFVGGPRFGVLGNQIDEERASINDNDKAITRNIGGIVIISKVVDGGRPTLAGRDPKIGHTKKESQRGLDQGHPYARGRNKGNMSRCSIRRGNALGSVVFNENFIGKINTRVKVPPLLVEIMKGRILMVLLKKLGFDGFEFSEARGFLGGICVARRMDKVNIEDCGLGIVWDRFPLLVLIVSLISFMRYNKMVFGVEFGD